MLMSFTWISKMMRSLRILLKGHPVQYRSHNQTTNKGNRSPTRRADLDCFKSPRQPLPVCRLNAADITTRDVAAFEWVLVSGAGLCLYGSYDNLPEAIRWRSILWS